MAKFKYEKTALPNKSCVYKEIKRWVNSEKVYKHSAQNLIVFPSAAQETKDQNIHNYYLALCFVSV